MAKRREIIEDHTFWEQARLLKPDAKRLDEILDGVMWQIANHAEECSIVEGALRVAFTEPYPDAPAMRIYFSITNDSLCTLHWIEHLPPSEGEEYL